MVVEEDTDATTVADLTADRLARLGFGRFHKALEPPVAVITKPKTEKVKGPPKRMGKAPLDPSVLRASQLRALAVLADTEATSGASAVTMAQMAAKSKLSVQSLKQGMGPPESHQRDAHDKRQGYRSLLTRGLVQVTELEGEFKYYLSPLGLRKVDDLEGELKVIKDKAPVSAGLDKRQGPKKPIANKKAPSWKKAKKRTKKEVEKVTDTTL